VADVTPTVLEALGLPPMEAATPGSGRSVWGLARGGTAGSGRALLAEGRLFGSDQRALILWPYKLVVDPESGMRRLTDLVADPAETHDLAAELPDLADEMEEALRESRVETGVRRGAPAGKVDPETARELEALGYVN
jgi:arylsulfatase A-like enzyme